MVSLYPVVFNILYIMWFPLLSQLTKRHQEIFEIKRVFPRLDKGKKSIELIELKLIKNIDKNHTNMHAHIYIYIIYIYIYIRLYQHK